MRKFTVSKKNSSVLTLLSVIPEKIVQCYFVFFVISCSLWTGDMRAGYPDQYNVVWGSQSENSMGSMPCGGHDIGLNIWVEDGDVLFYMQRSGSLAETNEYLKLGRVRLQLDPNPFSSEGQFRQELKLLQGYVEICGKSPQPGDQAIEATVRIWVETNRPVIHFEIEANQPVKADVAYENWRLTDEDIPNNNRRRSFFSLHKYPGKVTLSKDTIKRDGQGVLFYHRNPDDKLIPDMIILQQRLEAYKGQITDDLLGRTFGGMLIGMGFAPAGETEGIYQTKSFKAWHIASEKPGQKHHIRVVSHIAQTETVDDWRNGLQKLLDESKNDLGKAREATRNWWSAFWDRSWIVINPEKTDPSSKAWRAGRNYNLFRYQLGCNAFGEYPTKFNGGNLTFDANLVGGRGKGYGPDWRDWGGGVFTAQNQRLLYWPMLKAGDFDAIQPQFELYRKALGGACARVQKYFKHGGAVYCEYIGVPGIAGGFGWGWESGQRGRGREILFGDPRADATRGYNSLVEKGVMANQSIAYHWESQIEHAYMILEYHRFTGADISKYMPFIENAVIFFDEHYRLRKKMRSGKELDSRGKLVIYPSTSCESYRGATNPSDVISGLQACLEAMLKLDDGYLNLRDKAYYQAFLGRVPDYTFDEVQGDRILKPASSWKRYQNVECPQFYPLFPFNRFDLLGNDLDELTTFRNTWKHGKFPKNMVKSWHQDGIFFARMGMANEAADYNLKKLEDSPRRFPTFWGPGHDWVPDHNWGGSGMLGLQEMVIQTIGKKIYLLPAWPKNWDIDFKLHVPYQTIVEGKFRSGTITELNVTPNSRRKDVIMALKDEY